MFDSKTIGDEGEAISNLVLQKISHVEKYNNDTGLDFFCRLRRREELQFYVQSKGKPFPNYSQNGSDIDSLPIKISSVRKWIKLPYPVYVLMSDNWKKKCFYLLVTEQTLLNHLSRKNQKSITFKIPTNNEITEESIGHNFLNSVIENQPFHLASSDYLDEYKALHPILFHELSEIDSYLELLRSNTQDDQFKTKHIIFEKYQSTVHTPYRLLNGVLEIFRNCMDRITQIHSIEILSHYQHDRSTVIPEIIRQIERNLASFEFQETPSYFKYTYVDFLFRALIQYKASDYYNHFKGFLNYNVDYLTREVINIVAELKIQSAFDDIKPFTADQNEIIQQHACQALANLKFDLQKAAAEFPTITNPLEIAGNLILFKILEYNLSIETILNLLRNPHSLVVKRSLEYLSERRIPSSIKKVVLGLARSEEKKIKEVAYRIVILNGCFSNSEIREVAFKYVKIGLEQKDMGYYVLGIQMFFSKPNNNLAKKLIALYADILEKFSVEEHKIYRSFQSDLFHKINQINDQEVLNKLSFTLRSINTLSTSQFLMQISLLERLDEISLRDNLIKLRVTNLSDDLIKVSLMLKLDRLSASNLLQKLVNKEHLSVEEFIEFDDFARRNNLFLNSALLIKKASHLLKHKPNRFNWKFLDFCGFYCPRLAYEYVVQDLFENAPVEDQVHRSRLGVIAKTQTEQSKKLVIELLEKNIIDEKYILIQALGNLGDEESIKIIRRYSLYPDESIRRLVKEIIGCSNV